MFRQVNEVLTDAFPNLFNHRVQQSARVYSFPQGMKRHVIGMMSYHRVEKMRVQAMNTGQNNEYMILSNMIQDYLLPFRWNQMDMEFGA